MISTVSLGMKALGNLKAMAQTATPPANDNRPVDQLKHAYQSPKLMQALRFDAPTDLSISKEEQQAYRANNDEMAKKYPGLALVLKDPDAFMAEMSKRFDEQKQVNPQDPYAFDFSEYGMPFLKGLGGKLESKIEALKAEQEQLHNTFFLSPAAFGRAEKIADRGVGIEFLQALKNECAGLTEQGQVSYKRIQAIGHFAAYALGHFDHEKLNLPTRAFLEIDRHIEGHEDVSIQEQFRRYRDNQFTVFQAKAGSKGYARVEERYVKGFSNPDKLEMINLPSMDELENDIFMRMMNHPIYIAGVTGQPIPADGFVRPGGDFFLHDVRHNSGIFVERMDYIERNQMSPEQVAKMDKRSEVWYREFTEAVDKIKDPGLKGAVELVAFNFHHDRGHLMMPSNYLKDGAGPVPRALYAALKVSGQGAAYGVDKGLPNLSRGHEWLQDFFLSRLDQEIEILGKAPVPNPHL
ncbi:hypothetical protein JST97_12050 [bacterium]|nr:hypothetical protein [bacterium]